ncbi:MAG: ribosome maturation factor RimP [Oscillospiraceae bacterium]|nr:ribosome maturation factor RimP [Oscillospiraceae bacterium]
MKKPGKISLITGLVRPITEARGLILWDVALEKDGSDWFLRITIDGDRPVTLDDCEAVSRELDRLLDEHDPIDHAYCLEVSSAGIGRKLKKPRHFAAFIGKGIQVHLYRSQNGERSFTGILRGFEDNTIKLETNGKILEFKLSESSYVKAADDLDIKNE